ncbi:hypothetical protein ACFL5G_02910 [Candidatus Margulisiibacteriota bacterium]
MLKDRGKQVIVLIIVILLGTYFLYNSFSSRFNKVPKHMELTIFKNTKHFNISVFGEELSENDVKWVMNLCESFYGRAYQWYGDQSGKEWLTIYIAKGFPDYYRTNNEMILIPAERVKKRDSRFLAIKIAHLLTGSYKWPWYKDHIAAEGMAAYLADKYIGKRFVFQKKYEGKADLVKLDKATYFVWKMPQEQQDYVYAKAGAFIRYITEAYGINKIKALYADQGEGWEKVFGHSLEELVNKWRRSY